MVWSVDTVLWLGVQILQYPLALQSLDALAPGIAAAPRTNPLQHETSAEHGWLHCGPPGAGHFVKMVHNGIEYGIMQAYAEGFNILHHANLGSQFTLKKAMLRLLRWRIRKIIATILTVLKLLSYGVVVVWLVVGYSILPLLYYAAIESFSKFDGGVSDSGEGRWTVHAAVDLGVPAPVISSALWSTL